MNSSGSRRRTSCKQNNNNDIAHPVGPSPRGGKGAHSSPEGSGRARQAADLGGGTPQHCAVGRGREPMEDWHTRVSPATCPRLPCCCPHWQHAWLTPSSAPSPGPPCEAHLIARLPKDELQLGGQKLPELLAVLQHSTARGRRRDGARRDAARQHGALGPEIH